MSLINEIDNYKYPDDDKSSVRKFLWFCAGADIELLKHCPQSERIKEEGIGGVVLATAVLAWFSSFYAFYTVFRPKVGVAVSVVQHTTDFGTVLFAMIFASVWALVIFNLDRFIVSSSDHSGTGRISWSDFKGAIPRLVMAFIIGITLSAPIEIKVMESELDATLTTKQRDFVKTGRVAEDQRYEENSNALEKKLQEIKDARTKFQINIDDITKRERDEREKAGEDASGRAANGKTGCGEGCKTHNANADAAKTEKESLLSQ